MITTLVHPRADEAWTGLDDAAAARARAHLLAEVARIDVRVARLVRCWQLAGRDPGDAFLGLYVSDADAAALATRPVAAGWSHGVALPPAEVDAFATAEAGAARRAEDMAAQCPGGPPLRRLAAAFELDAFDVGALLVALAPALDLRYERLYGYLQDDVTRRQPGVSLTLDLLCPPAVDRLAWLGRFDDSAPLLRQALLRRERPAGAGGGPLLADALAVDETVVAYLLGRHRPGQEMADHVTLTWPVPAAADQLLAADVVDDLARVTIEPALVSLHGPDRARAVAAARLLAARLEQALLTVDLPAESGDVDRILRLALRDARLFGALPVLLGWDACLDGGLARSGPMATVTEHPGPVVLVSREPWRRTGDGAARPVYWLAMDALDYDQRLALWQHFAAACGSPASTDLAPLAGQFVLSGGQIRDAVTQAVEASAGPPDGAALFAAARLQSGARLGGLAHKITPRYDWADLILPPDQARLLQEAVATIRSRPWVLRHWGVGRKLAPSSGVRMLFAGPPGTGKTMAAEVIAADLGVDLYKIDLSVVVSKYIGETEKNLERIFAAAESSNAILFFDEADALFGKRSEVRDSHDRYANIEISYLLQRMEAYDGVTILATNLRANLDDAFTRRLDFAVDFPFPEPEDRLRIWHALFPPELPRDPDVDFTELARRHRLAGGNIRNIIVTAAHLAAAGSDRVSMDLVRHATRRELQKIGRLVAEDHRDVERDSQGGPP